MNRVFGIARGDDLIVSNIVEKDQQPDTQNLVICWRNEFDGWSDATSPQGHGTKRSSTAASILASIEKENAEGT